MRTWQSDASRRRAWPTVLAILVLLTYAVLAASAQLGGAVVGQGLDPVWAAAQQRGVLRVATDFGYAPFTGIRRDTAGREQPYGFDIDVAQEIGRMLGLRITFVPTSLESAYEALAADRADLVISALPYAPEQGWRATFSSFYFNAGQVLIVPEASKLTQSDQLAGLKIGVALGSDADTFARSLVQNPSVRLSNRYDTPALAFADLRRGTLDAVIADNAAALIAMNQAPGLRFVPPALTLEPYAIAVSNRAFLLRERVNAVLETLRDEGWFARKTAQWFR